MFKKGAKFKKYIGHSAHVTNIRFSLDSQSVLSVGGADHAIFQWRYNSDEIQNGDDGSYDDDDYSEKDSNSLLPVDSDVEKDNERCYDRLLDKTEVAKVQKRNRKKEKKKTSLTEKRENPVSKLFRPISSQDSSDRPRVVANESQEAPEDSLQLVHVFG